MAANGQRIHPADPRSVPSDTRHAATPAASSSDPYREHDACGVGFVACASGARSHEVVSMALEAVARVAHRGAASTDQLGRRRGSPDSDPRASVLSRRLPPRPSSAAGTAVRRRLVLPAPPARRARRRGRHDRRGAGGRRHPVPRLAGRAPQSGGPRAHGARLLPGDPPGAGGPSGARRGRRGVGACPLPRTTRDGATCGRAKSRRLLRLLPLLPHRGLQGAPHGDSAPSLLHRLPLPRVRERDRGLPPALLDQHPAELAAGAAVPAAGPQRRDQHALGQPERDDDAPADAGLTALGRPDRTGSRCHLEGRERLGEPGQRHGAAGPLGTGRRSTRR